MHQADSYADRKDQHRYLELPAMTVTALPLRNVTEEVSGQGQ